MAVARTRSELEALARDAPVEWLAESVALPDGCARIVEETRARLGPVEILVCNAGVGSAHERRVWEQDPAVWREAMTVNLDAPFELTRLALPEMLERRFGRIVMVGSLAALAAGAAPGMSAYVASKAGLVGFTRAVALEVAAYGVTCNAVLPGSVRTRMAEVKVGREAEDAGISVDEAWERRAQRVQAGRLVTAEEVAATIAFLASDEASGINGEAVTVALQGYG
jgi:NAD(P)-dependent dehydrogenase (short-subunit alcohol dehydrogenase family)